MNISPSIGGKLATGVVETVFCRPLEVDNDVFRAVFGNQLRVDDFRAIIQRHVRVHHKKTSFINMGAIGGENHLVPSARPFFKDLLSWCEFLIPNS